MPAKFIEKKVRAMDISIIIPVYNEVDSLPGLYSRVAETLATLAQSAEIIFANDGSKDGSAAVLDAFAAADPRVRVVHLRRNYGQTAALMAALQHSSGGNGHANESGGPKRPPENPPAFRET